MTKLSEATFHYSLEHFFLDIDNLAGILRKYTQLGYPIFAPPRGGLIPGVMLSHKLDAQLYTDLHDVPPKSSILLVDEIIDTGKTIAKCIALAEARAIHIRAIGALVARRGSYPFPCVAARHILEEEANWVRFWWESSHRYTTNVGGTLQQPHPHEGHD